jgi:hypothetical protein
MDDQKKVIAIAVAILAFIGIAGTILYFTVLKKPATTPAEAAGQAEVLKAPEAAAPAPAESAGGDALRLPPVGLDESDPVVRDYAAGLSLDGRFGRWLQTKSLVRTFVVIVDNIANGQSPKSHVDFFAPEGRFKVAFEPGGTFVDPASYDRYDPVAEVVSSIDAPAAARFYKGLSSLIKDAYDDLGYPDTDFNDTLVRALRELLEVPVVDGQIRLESKVLSFEMTDDELEALSPAQKHLLRMGPKNVQAVQAKLRELAAALGVPDSRLPRTKVHKTADGRP